MSALVRSHCYRVHRVNLSLSSAPSSPRRCAAFASPTLLVTSIAHSPLATSYASSQPLAAAQQDERQLSAACAAPVQRSTAETNSAAACDAAKRSAGPAAAAAGLPPLLPLAACAAAAGAGRRCGRLGGRCRRAAAAAGGSRHHHRPGWHGPPAAAERRGPQGPVAPRHQAAHVLGWLGAHPGEQPYLGLRCMKRALPTAAGGGHAAAERCHERAVHVQGCCCPATSSDGVECAGWLLCCQHCGMLRGRRAGQAVMPSSCLSDCNRLACALQVSAAAAFVQTGAFDPARTLLLCLAATAIIGWLNLRCEAGQTCRSTFFWKCAFGCVLSASVCYMTITLGSQTHGLSNQASKATSPRSACATLTNPTRPAPPPPAATTCLTA